MLALVEGSAYACKEVCEHTNVFINTDTPGKHDMQVCTCTSGVHKTAKITRATTIII